mgnify:FL=1
MMIFISFISHSPQAMDTNLNKISGEFDQYIMGRRELESGIESQITDFRKTPVKPTAIEILEPKRDSALENIDAHSLEEKGRGRRHEKDMSYFSNLNPDISLPGAKKHIKDIGLIISKTKAKLKSLTAFLRKNGIDCKHEKQEKFSDLESNFYLDIENIPSKEVEYKKELCEQKKNQYNCRSALQIHCEEKSKKWGPWQEKNISISGDELLKSHGFFYPHYVARKTFELKLFSKSSYRRKGGVRFDSVPAMKAFLVDKLGLDKDNFDDNMGFSWDGGIHQVGHKLYVWARYHISYRYRDGTNICKKWSKEYWEESCSFI